MKRCVLRFAIRLLRYVTLHLMKIHLAPLRGNLRHQVDLPLNHGNLPHQVVRLLMSDLSHQVDRLLLSDLDHQVVRRPFHGQIG